MSQKSAGANTSAGNIPQAQTPMAAQPTLAAAPPKVKVQSMELLDMQALDPSSLDPDRHYRWVRTTSDDQPTGMSVTRHKLRGYEVETYRDGGPRTLAEAPAGEDNTVRMGDLILMSCPKALRQERMKQAERQSEERLAANSVTTEEQARKLGVRVIKDRE